MAFPVIENVALVLKARLEALTTAAGYSWTADVKRPVRLGGWVAKDKQVVIVQGLPVRDDENSTDGNPPATAWWWRFRIGVVVIDSESSTTPLDTTTNIRAADAQKAICTLTGSEAAGVNWAHFNNYALSARFADPTALVDETGSEIGVVLELDVLVRHSEVDPYTLVG